MTECLLSAEVVPPVVELCPDNIQITTGEPLTEVQRPSVVFRTTKGGLAPFVCSSFGSEHKHSFPLGTHHITCTAFDPDFGDTAPSTCSFIIKVKGERISLSCVVIFNTDLRLFIYL